MVKPRNPEQDPVAMRANAQAGYGPNNPEPARFKASAKEREKSPSP